MLKRVPLIFKQKFKQNYRTWHGDMRSIPEKHQIGRTDWDYNGGFGIIDRKNENKPIDDLIGVLTD